MAGSVYVTAVIIIMFFGSSAFLSMDITDLVFRMKTILIDNPDNLLQDKLAQADNRLKKLVWTGNILFIFMVNKQQSKILCSDFCTVTPWRFNTSLENMGNIY